MIQSKLLIYHKQDRNSDRLNKLTSFRRSLYRNIFWLVASLLIFVFSSCTKWLDVKPESETVLEDYWTSKSDAEAVVAACYRSLAEYECMNRIILWGEGRSDNVVPNYTKANEDADFRKMVMFSFIPDNQFTKWGSFYTVINYCNTFLEYASKAQKLDPNFTEAELNTLSAEVKTIRALAYFYLVRTFGGVPLIVSPSINDTQDYNIAQSSEQEILAFLVKDLNNALLYAPTSFSTLAANKGRITKKAIRSLLADIYLWDMQYANCVQMCNEIIADSKLRLITADESPLYTIFTARNSEESIFELQYGEEHTSELFNFVMRDYYRGKVVGEAMLRYSENLVKTIYDPFNFKNGSIIESANDNRFKDYIYSYTIFKYSGYSRSEVNKVSSYTHSTGARNWIFYRLADVMLMKAEALVQLDRGDDDRKEAIRMVNLTYLRSNPDETDSLTLTDYSGKSALSKLVLRERQRELLFEGKRWFDLMRYARQNKSVGLVLEFINYKFQESGSRVNANAGIDALLLPVNSEELKANTKLKQNPYYELANGN